MESSELSSTPPFLFFKKGSSMAQRNFKTKTTNMLNALYILIGLMFKSYESIRTMRVRAKAFITWLELNTSVRKLEDITKEQIIEYSRYLNEKYCAKTAQNYLSAINVCLQFGRGDKKVWVSADKDTKIPRKSYKTDVYKGLSDEDHLVLVAQSSPSLQSLFSVSRFLGLRFKEACLLDNRAALNELTTKGKVSVINGSKGGRKREVIPEVTSNDKAIKALEIASSLQGKSNNIIPSHMTYVSFKRNCYKEATNLKARFHSERHSYANWEYSRRMSKELGYDVKTPVTDSLFFVFKGSWCEFLAERFEKALDEVKSIDEKVRLEVSSSLGHNRIDIISAYIGGR